MLSGFHTSVTLKNAREAALKDRNYDSEGTRQTMSQKLKDVFNGRSPYDWQLDAAESLILGLDCVVVAGTGAGKTIPFMLPLLLHDSRNKVVLIISPLNALEMDQVRFSLTVPALYTSANPKTAWSPLEILGLSWRDGYSCAKFLQYQ